MSFYRSILVWTLLLLVFTLTGQNTEEVMSKSIDLGSGNGYGRSIVNGFDGNYFIASPMNCPFTSILCIGLVELDSELKAIQKEIYKNSTTSNRYSGRDGMVTIGDSIIALASTYYKSIEGNGYTIVSMLTLMDKNFLVLDTFHFHQDVPGPSSISSIRSVGDTSILMSGTKNAVSGTNLFKHSWLKKINLSGEEIWEKEFNRGPYQSISIESMELLGNGDILMGMQHRLTSGDYIGNTLLLDAEGEIKQEYIFQDTSSKGSSLVTAINDSIFVLNWNYVSKYIFTFFIKTTWIHGFHRNGELLWSHHFDLKRGADAEISSIRPTSDYGVIGVGHTDWTRFISKEKMLPTDPSTAGWAFKLSGEGELEWEKFYYDPRHLDGSGIPALNIFYDVIETPQSDFIMVGLKIDTIGLDSLNSNIWALKTDANGCLIGHYHCDTLQIVGDSTRRMLDIYTDVVYEWQEEELSIYPNPASDHLNIEFPEMSGGVLRLVNLKGEMMMEKAFQNQSQVDLQLGTYPSGMYLLEYFDVDQRKYSRSKVVIQ